jgi:hypothetical protein
VRLRTFVPPRDDIAGAIEEFVRILGTLPPDGLILDVRGNEGGLIAFGERCLQLLTPRPITPAPFHFLSTALTLALARDNDDLKQWNAPIALGIATGASFSQGFPLTTAAECNDRGQVYQGPVILVVDALCYSTTDLFAAGFQDHGIGRILGTHRNTGAGGANVWHHEDLRGLTLSPSNPFVRLPQGAGLRVAARRSTRLGSRTGVPLEDLGVEPDEFYEMTRADVLEHNVDLIAHAAQWLAGQPTQRLGLTAGKEYPVERVTITGHNIDRVDLLVRGRPLLSQDFAGARAEVKLPFPQEPGNTLLACGYRANELVVSTRLPV